MLAYQGSSPEITRASYPELDLLPWTEEERYRFIVLVFRCDYCNITERVSPWNNSRKYLACNGCWHRMTYQGVTDACEYLIHTCICNATLRDESNDGDLGDYDELGR